MSDHHETYPIVWEGIALSVRWNPTWPGKVGDGALAHLELVAENRQRLPMTATGYRSHFVPRSEVEAYGGPVAYARAWLDHEAQSPAWKAHAAASRQLSLF